MGNSRVGSPASDLERWDDCFRFAAAIPEASVRLFGSCAKGTSRPDSGVDLLNIPAIASLVTSTGL